MVTSLENDEIERPKSKVGENKETWNPVKIAECADVARKIFMV